MPTSDSSITRPLVDFNAVKVELEEFDNTSCIVHAVETTNVKMQDIASNESTGMLMFIQVIVSLTDT